MKRFALLGTLLLSWIGLPLLGALWGDRLAFLNWPPRPTAPPPSSFSWSTFVLVATAELPLYLALFWALWRSCWRWPEILRWPRWGWGALALLLSAWLLAWSELGEGIKPLQFTLLWTGYIAVVNALITTLGGRSLRFTELLKLALISAPFWWLFEFYNLFLQNWYYLGSEELSDREWTLFASLAFATVLPAVYTTYRLLEIVVAVRFRPVSPELLPKLSPSLSTSGALALLLLPLFPEKLFPLVWIAPFSLFAALEWWLEGEGLLADLGQGRWETVVLGALAGLICGLFWEMWNFWSDPKWRYAIPDLQGLRLFEMPLPGYAGYLPFGIGCVALSSWWLRKSRPLSSKYHSNGVA